MQNDTDIFIGISGIIDMLRSNIGFHVNKNFGIVREFFIT